MTCSATYVAGEEQVALLPQVGESQRHRVGLGAMSYARTIAANQERRQGDVELVHQASSNELAVQAWPPLGRHDANTTSAIKPMKIQAGSCLMRYPTPHFISEVPQRDGLHFRWRITKRTGEKTLFLSLP